MEKKIATTDHDKDFPVKNFKLGVKETVDKREAQVVHYQIHNKIYNDLSDMTIWIDTKTQLPLKRVTNEKAEGKPDDGDLQCVPVYSKLDGKLFEIPAK